MPQVGAVHCDVCIAWKHAQALQIVGMDNIQLHGTAVDLAQLSLKPFQTSLLLSWQAGDVHALDGGLLA